MMAVSCTKAMLVILFFMHVKYEANWKYVLTIPAGMMSMFLMLMLVPDVGMRMRNPLAGHRASRKSRCSTWGAKPSTTRFKRPPVHARGIIATAAWHRTPRDDRLSRL